MEEGKLFWRTREKALRNLVRNVSVRQRKEGSDCRAPGTLERAGKLEFL